MGVPLETVAGLVRPVVLAGDRLLPALDAVAGLLPDGGLRRGSVVAVEGSTSLALALVAGASAAGSWGAAAGFGTLGLGAVAETGIVLDRFPVVATPPDAAGWAWTVAALVDALDVVVAQVPARLGEAPARRLAARVRERGSVLVASGGRWPGADVRLAVVAAAWEGVGEGHGGLRARRVEVVAGGRGSAARERRASLWLPAPGGGVAPAPSAEGGARATPAIPAVPAGADSAALAAAR